MPSSYGFTRAIWSLQWLATGTSQGKSLKNGSNMDVVENSRQSFLNEFL
jgi:hypothetical protein